MVKTTYTCHELDAAHREDYWTLALSRILPGLIPTSDFEFIEFVYMEKYLVKFMYPNVMYDHVFIWSSLPVTYYKDGVANFIQG